MARFLTRLFAESTIRLNKRAYRVETNVTSLAFHIGEQRVAVVDQFVPLGAEWVSGGLSIQTEFEAPDITIAIDQSRARALPILSLLSMTGGGSVNLPMPIWAYDVTPGVVDR